MQPFQHAALDKQALHEAGLRYVSCQNKGYQRVPTNDGFAYLDTKGVPIQNPEILARIQALVIPPAWTQVWICETADGHIQATGLDARNRKQYRYHPLWVELRNRDKFGSLYIFGQRLPRLKKRIAKDLSRRTLSRDRVCALALAIMSKTYFRVGNTVYEKENQSFGLTTLRNRHAQISSHKVFFRFIGKKGVRQQSFLTEKTLVRLLTKVKDIPGQRLFQYYNDNGEPTPLDSGNLNNYIKDAMGADITCKTLRTWYGSILALYYLGQSTMPNNSNERKHRLLEVIDVVAQHLGNTRAVTRSHYIHPVIPQAYLEGTLDHWIKRTSNCIGLQPDDSLYTRKLMQLIRT